MSASNGGSAAVALDVPRLAAQSPLQGRFYVPASEVEGAIRGRTPQQVQAYLLSLVEPASTLARPPISKFNVGAVGLGASGAIYVGVNLEFPGLHLNNSVHAEQCLLLNCLLHGERGIQVLAVSEAPCGHCRQFYCEVDQVDDMLFVFGAGLHWLEHHPSASASGCMTDAVAAAAAGVPGSAANGGSMGSSASAAVPTPRATSAYRLDQLLPARFGPMDLMSEDETFPLLLALQTHQVEVTGAALAAAQEEVAGVDGVVGKRFVEAVREAEQWARKSYSPYTKSPSGAAIITKDGKVYAGGYVESVAFNPSLTPFHGAWVAAVVDHIAGFDQIAHVVLAQLPDAKVQHADGVRALLQSVSPAARVTNVRMSRSS